MAYHALIWLLLIVSAISGCATTHSPKQAKPKRQRLIDVYAGSVGQSRQDMKKFIDDKLTEQNTYGYVKPYVPVIEAPLVRKVWVPDRKSEADADVLVAGHWSYVMVQGPKWFIDTERVDEAPAKVLVPGQPVVKENSSAGLSKVQGRK